MWHPMHMEVHHLAMDTPLAFSSNTGKHEEDHVHHYAYQHRLNKVKSWSNLSHGRHRAEVGSAHERGMHAGLMHHNRLKRPVDVNTPCVGGMSGMEVTRPPMDATPPSLATAVKTFLLQHPSHASVLVLNWGSRLQMAHFNVSCRRRYD